MSNIESPQEFLFLYQDYGNPNKETKQASVFGKSIKDALYMFNTTIVKGNPDIRVTGVYQPLTEEETRDPWERNVQYLRVEFPPLEDAQQDEEAGLLAKFITAHLRQRFMGCGFNTAGIVSLSGFHRGDRNWDNIDTPDACVCGPDRGSGENEP